MQKVGRLAIARNLRRDDEVFPARRSTVLRQEPWAVRRRADGRFAAERVREVALVPCFCDRGYLKLAKYKVYDLLMLPLLPLLRPCRCELCGRRFYAFRWAFRWLTEYESGPDERGEP